jgi:hypothetical protein
MRDVIKQDLTERMAKALAFVQANGSSMMRTFAAHAAGHVSGDEALAAMVEFQNPDGGWRAMDTDMKGPISTISCTWPAIQWLLWIRPNDTLPLDRTVEFLRNVQQESGCWDEPQDILNYDPPPWMVPGDHAVQLWLTSAVCCKLLEFGRQIDVRFDDALAFLRAGWDGKRYPLYAHTHWMALLLFASLEHPAPADRQIAKGCAQFLMDALLEGSIDPFDFIEIAQAAFHARDFAHDLFDVAFERVLNHQADDGGWETNYGERHRPWCTTNAMFLLRAVRSAL